MSECYEEIMLFSHYLYSDLIFHFIKRPEGDFRMGLYPQTKNFSISKNSPHWLFIILKLDADNWKVPKFLRGIMNLRWMIIYLD